MSEWTFSLRKGRAHDYDSDASEEEHCVSFTASGRPESKSQPALGEETVQFQESPWTIAKLNAANRKRDDVAQDAPDTPSLSHQPVASTQNAARCPPIEKQLTLETAIQRQSKPPLAVAHVNNTTKSMLSGTSGTPLASPLTRTQQSKPSPAVRNNQNHPASYATSFMATPGADEHSLAYYPNIQNARQNAHSAGPNTTTGGLHAPATHHAPTPPSLQRAVKDPLYGLNALNSSLEMLPSVSLLPVCGSLVRKTPKAASRVAQSPSETMLPPTAKPQNSPAIVTRPSTFVSSLIAETLSQQSQYPKHSQTSPRGEFGRTPDMRQPSGLPTLTSCPEGDSHNSSEGVRHLDDAQSLKEVGIKTPAVTHAQEDVQVERFSPYLDEGFSPLQVSPTGFFRHSEQEVYCPSKPLRIPNVSTRSSSPFVLSATSPSPSFPPQTRPTRPISSLPMPSKFRCPRPRISRVDLDRDAVWSTLPSRKRKTPAGPGDERKRGIRTTPRFSLPIALPHADDTLSGTSSLRTASIYRPPPRPPKAEWNSEARERENQDGEKPGSADTSANEATSWQLVKIMPSMLKDPKFK